MTFADLDNCEVTAPPTSGTLATARAAAELTPLIGGDVLVTGGFTKDGSQVRSVGTAEIYVRRR